MVFPRTVLCIVLLSFFLTLYSQEDSPLFASEEVLELQIHTDIPAIQGDRTTKEVYRSATLICSEGKSIPVEVKVRGNFRKRPDICSFPPLKLKLPLSASRETPFDGQSKLKLVTHCQGDDLVLKEYMVYKTLNLLTPNSFKVRLVKIKYKDISKKEGTQSHFGILLESTKHLVKRLGGSELEKARLEPTSLSEENLAIMSLFHYMIGNTDWDVTLDKNVKIVGFPEEKEPLAIPYDFDMAGVVMAPYSDKYIGAPESRRKFRPVACKRTILEEAIVHFRENKEAIYTLYTSCPYLKKKEVNKALAYFDKFYAILDTQESVEKVFMSQLAEEDLSR
ncbi:MAG: hypothetical protein AAF655_00915 [Bacteroidota bacterium]